VFPTGFDPEAAGMMIVEAGGAALQR